MNRYRKSKSGIWLKDKLVDQAGFMPGLLPAYGPGGPTPPPSTNMEVWLKMPISGLVNNDQILTWPDSSGNSKDGIGQGGGAEPTYKTNIIDGFAAARFVASNAFTPMSIAVLATTESWTEATIYILVKRTVDPGPGDGSGTALWQFSANETLSTHYNFSDNNIYDSAFSNARKNTGNPTADLSTNFRLYCVKSKSADWTSYIDGTQHFHTGTNTFSAVEGAGLGQGGAAGGLFGCNADVVELIIYKAWHDDTTRGLVETYFSARFPSLDF